ncbi:hypothetical protein [Archaeoglobus profundus]|uniref:Uncharacterized protein n=1 Tax=Archaeoglobus profundus (strain DSM 5631 / JCM 9629 / NBRC 100127 / Av18) TaxID=572546 RepID=D2RDG1_ARCPA|nr:hypothetical protein [Archaeoglobus profundus]ADB58155.1 hypothetical protein Arcpr_1096 [Archaeoglobus profundus DSM 5631]
MRAYIINPIQKIFFEGRVYDIEPANGFGGFCDCGGIMSQRGWVDNWLMVAECESCWKVEAFLYDDYRFVERFEVKVLALKDFLNEILTGSEFEALIQKANGANYSYNSFSRAKRKLEEMNLRLEDILKYLRGTQLP